MPPRKLRRKDIRQPDEFITTAERAWQWVRTHPLPVGALAGAIVVLTAGGALFARSRAARAEAAAAAFAKAREELAAGHVKAAAAKFSEIERKYHGTPGASLAQLYEGHAAMRQGEPLRAAAAYQRYLEAGAASSYLRQEALVGLAAAREETGDVQAALSALAQAASIPGPFETEARLAEARLRVAAGEPEKARAIYASLLAEHREGALRNLVAMNLASLPAARSGAKARTGKATAPGPPKQLEPAGAGKHMGPAAPQSAEPRPAHP